MAAIEDVRRLLAEAVQLERAGRFAEAEVAYQRLLERAPALPDSWYNLALLQKKLGRFDAALASYQQALNHGVSQPEEVHLNRGVIYADCLRQDDAAEKELQTALQLNSNYVPALLNLANLYEDLGRRDEALARYEELLALAPDYYEALARYASLKGISGQDDSLVARLKQGIADPSATAADKASLGFALGKVLDACGAYDPAFLAYANANQYSRESAAAGSVPYDRDRQEKLVDELIATFTPGRFKPATSVSSAAPIFICGMFRSGSTLTEQVLAGHSRVKAGGEIDFIPALVRTELAPFPARMAQVTPQHLDRYAARYRDQLSKLFPGAEHVTDKRPDNFLYIGFIKSLFPNAKIIHTTREMLDNCLSIYFLHLDHSMGYALDLVDTGHYYRQYRRLMVHWKSLYGADILDFDYDAFVRGPKPAVEKLLAFCGLDWEEGCMSFQRVGSAVKTASVWQVREPLYQRSSGRWRHYERQLVRLREYLRDLSR